MLAVIRRWGRAKTDDPAALQADARILVAADEVNAYYEAQCRAAQARVRGDGQEFFHWAKVAAEVARLAPPGGDGHCAIAAEEEAQRA